MLLTVDIGNSNIVFGLPEGDGRSRKLYRLGTVADRPAEEYSALADSLFARESVDFSQVDGAVICSVVPVLVPVLSRSGTAPDGNRALRHYPSLRKWLDPGHPGSGYSGK